jgi:hypothetical protein
MILKTSLSLGCLTLAFQAGALCTNPETPDRICYNEQGGTPQNLTLKEINFMAKFLRSYGRQDGNPAFYTMKVADADNCGEWQVTTGGNALVLAKLVGNQDTSVTFNDIANTIDGGEIATDADKAKAIVGCGTGGGQMSVAINATDPLYQSPDYVNGGFINTGILLKVVHKAS